MKHVSLWKATVHTKRRMVLIMNENKFILSMTELSQEVGSI